MKRNYPPNYVIAMDKTAVCCNMIGNTSFNVTGEKDIPLQLTGNR